MHPSEVTLRGFLAQAGDLSAKMLHGAAGSVSLEIASRCTGFSNREDLRDRSVLIGTEDQLTTSLVLIELDGIARRIILCPPGLDEAYLAGIVQQAEVDTIISGEDRSVLSTPGPRAISYAGASLPNKSNSEMMRETEWVLTTSGTTGAPKLVAHTLRGLVGAIGPTAASRQAPVWATFYDIRRYGGLQIFLRAIVGGASMIFSHAGEPLDEHLHRLARHGVTHVSGTPSHWRRVLMSPERALISPNYVRLSGEIADQALLNALKEAFNPADVSHAYASTEAGVAFNVTDGLEGFPVGFIADSQGSDVEMKIAEGSLRIRSDRTARGYIGTAEQLHDVDGFVDTGDMVEQRGDRYYFVGRRGGIINVGGMKVHPEEVESVINAHPLVRMSRVSARKNPITGALVQAEIVLNAGARQLGVTQEIAALCRANLPPHKIPSRITVVDQLAVTSGGKLARPNG
jgi:acyl-coenzyme A synthetase/AMP-(fatty) acid ligase